MPKQREFAISRRSFLKLSGATAAGAALGAGPALASGQATPARPAGKLVSKYSVCDMCFNKCGIIARVRDGVVEKLDPNPKFLKSRGMLCARGNAGIAQLYSPDRLKHPLLRKGKRGEGKWQRIGWDEALDMAASKLLDIAKKYSRCGVMFMAGADMQSVFVHRFATAFGSYNRLSHESQCLIAGTRAFLDTFGEVPFADLLHTKYVLMAGANRFEALVTPDSIDLMTGLRKNGAKLVVLDPRYTKTAALAQEWHAIKPGTDMAFMLAVAHVIIGEKLYDADYIKNKTYGFEQLAAHVANYTPRWAEAECEIPAADIARIAREMAKAAPRAMVYPGRRSSNYSNSTQIRRAYAIVNALLGNWDQPGGLLAARQVGLKGGIPLEEPFYEGNPEGRIDEHRSPMMFEEEGSMKHARDAVLEDKPYPVRGFVSYKTNPMQTVANQRKTIAMLDKMEFHLAIDIVMSDTAWMADLVLPSQSYLERTDPASALQGSSACACVVKRDQVVPAMHQAKPVFWMMKELAKRTKLGKHFDFTIEQYRKAQLAELTGAEEIMDKDGVYYNPSRVYGIYDGKIFKTKSHKIEFYNQRYKQMGVDPLPVYSQPGHFGQGKFRMVVGRSAVITQSSSTNNGLLQEFLPTNHLWIHPQPAKALGIADGDLVKVKSPAGEGALHAKVTTRTRPDTVYMETGFGVLSKGLSHLQGKGAAVANLLVDGVDKLSGNIAMHMTLVSVSKEAA